MIETIVVVPCYNEAERLEPERFREFARRSDDVALLFVNDGSTDDTREILFDLRDSNPERLLVHDLPQNRGKAEAVRQGLLRAFELEPRFVGFWDADLATPLDAISQFRDVLVRRGEFRLVIGSRVKLLGRSIHRKSTRHVLGRCFATIASCALGLPVYDTQCGAKMFRVSPEISDLFQQPFCSRWIFDVEILARMIRGARSETLPPADEIVYELPLDKWEDVGGSKLKSGDFVKAIWELWTIWRTYLAGSKKLLSKQQGESGESGVAEETPAGDAAQKDEQERAA